MVMPYRSDGRRAEIEVWLRAFRRVGVLTTSVQGPPDPLHLQPGSPGFRRAVVARLVDLGLVRGPQDPAFEGAWRATFDHRV